MITLQKDTADPQLTEQLDALSEKFDEAYNNNDAAALAALWLFRRYGFGCRRILAMLERQRQTVETPF
jgi:hypothetical protein